MIPIPPALLALFYRLAAYAAIAVALYAFGRFHQMVIFERERDQMIIQGWEEGDKHVANYRKKVGELADARTVASRLHRLCRAGRPGGTAGTASAAPPDSADRRADGEGQEAEGPLEQLGAELLVVQDNRYQCEELIELVSKQVYNRKSWWEFWK